MIATRVRLVAALALLGVVAYAVATHFSQWTEAIGPQPPAVGLVERQMKREIRRGRLRLLLDGRVLEVRANGEAVMGYTGRPPVIDAADPDVVRGIAKRALDLYAPERFGRPDGLDSVRLRLRHVSMFGPISYRVRERVFGFSTKDLRP